MEAYADFFMLLFVLCAVRAIYTVIGRIFKPEFFAEKLVIVLGSVGVALGVILISRAFLPFYDHQFARLVLFLALSVLMLLMSFSLSRRKKYSMNELDAMNGREFEIACAEILKANGFTNVEITQSTRDYGVDILARFNGEDYAIQCKCYSRKLDNAPVQEVVGGLAYYGCERGAVLTNSFFTEAAENLALANGIELWDRDTLEELCRKAREKRI